MNASRDVAEWLPILEEAVPFVVQLKCPLGDIIETVRSAQQLQERQEREQHTQGDPEHDGAAMGPLHSAVGALASRSTSGGYCWKLTGQDTSGVLLNGSPPYFGGKALLLTEAKLMKLA